MELTVTRKSGESEEFSGLSRVQVTSGWLVLLFSDGREKGLKTDNVHSYDVTPDKKGHVEHVGFGGML